MRLKLTRIAIQKPTSGTKLVILIAITGGLFSPLLINNASRFLGVSQGWGMYAISSAFFFVIGWLIQYASLTNATVKEKMQYVGFTGLAIAPGVMIDATIDFYARHSDRNIFPMEILLWWIFGSIPLLFGIMIGEIFFDFKPAS